MPQSRDQASASVPLRANDVLILMMLVRAPRHGYGIMRDVAERSEQQVVLQTGALYRTLRRLLNGRLIEECPRPAGVDSDDERRRYYQPTTLGRTVLAAEVDRLARLVRAAKLSADGKRARLV